MDASVDEHATESPDSVEALGARLRTIRERAGLSARALARRLGISASAVSQIERGTMQPSVSRLMAIVDALGVPLTDVFGAGPVADEAAPTPPAQGFSLTRAWENEAVTLEDGVTFRRLAPGQTQGVDLFESTYPPGSSATAHAGLHRHQGFEAGTVTSGELTIEFEQETVVLRPGDSISFPCSMPHHMRNQSGTTLAVATWINVHPR